MRRRAHRQCIEQEAELHPLLLGRELQQREDARLDVRLVDPEGASAELLAVSDEVVGVGERVGGVTVRLSPRPRAQAAWKGMVHGRFSALSSSEQLEHREVGDPEAAPGVLVD